MENLAGKVALVTGASSGIGECVTRRLVRAGVKVIGCARDTQKIQELSDNLKDSEGFLDAIECDVSKEDQVLALFEKIQKQYGGVDICICNAGLSYNSPILTGKTEEWRHMFDVNVIGVLMCCREGVNAMKQKAANDGHVIVICGESGHRLLQNKDLHVYCAAKHSLRIMTEGLRRELADQKSNIRVTTISPGVTETQFLYRRYPDNPEIAEKKYAAKLPLQTEDIADSVMYCLNAPIRAQVEEILVTPTQSRF